MRWNSSRAALYLLDSLLLSYYWLVYICLRRRCVDAPCPRCHRDPYIWRDGAGIYHALAHAFTPFYGVHAFVHPADIPRNLSDPHQTVKWTLGGVAYGNSVNYTDRGPFEFSRRERPHLVWKHGAVGVTPVALSNGVEYGERANTAGEDTIFTLVQEIQQ